MSEQTEMRIKMKTLVLAEKPSVGRDIGRVLHCTPQGNGFLEGKDYIVTWGLGHLVTLKDPEGYDKKYKEWKMEELPIMPKKLETEVIRQTAKQFQTVKKLVQRQDVKEIVIATDAGREGELLSVPHYSNTEPMMGKAIFLKKNKRKRPFTGKFFSGKQP